MEDFIQVVKHTSEDDLAPVAFNVLAVDYPLNLPAAQQHAQNRHVHGKEEQLYDRKGNKME
jgi:hypothetical protein